MKRRIRGVILIVLGLTLTFYGAFTFDRYDREASAAAKNAEVLLVELEHEMYQNRIDNVTVDAPENQMPQLTLEGYPLIGILKATKAGIELPVIDNWNYDKLKFAPCRYSGSLGSGNLVLIGHNYEGHLKTLNTLKEGDAVSFTDITGKEHNFTVRKYATLAPEQIDALTSPEYDMTVVTCTSTGKSRFAIYCVKNEE